MPRKLSRSFSSLGARMASADATALTLAAWPATEALSVMWGGDHPMDTAVTPMIIPDGSRGAPTAAAAAVP